MTQSWGFSGAPVLRCDNERSPPVKDAPRFAIDAASDRP